MYDFLIPLPPPFGRGAQQACKAKGISVVEASLGLGLFSQSRKQSLADILNFSELTHAHDPAGILGLCHYSCFPAEETGQRGCDSLKVTEQGHGARKHIPDFLPPRPGSLPRPCPSSQQISEREVPSCRSSENKTPTAPVRGAGVS